MNIRKLAYQLYIIHWKHEHITPEIEMDAWKNYFEDTDDDDLEDQSFEDYLWDCGYSEGTLFVCFEEFLSAEYHDKDFIKGLLDNEKLIELYLKDLESLQQ